MKRVRTIALCVDCHEFECWRGWLAHGFFLKTHTHHVRYSGVNSATAKPVPPRASVDRNISAYLHSGDGGTTSTFRTILLCVISAFYLFFLTLLCFVPHQVPIEHWHLMDVLYACTDQSQIALEVIRVNEELDLKTAAKMYAVALEVREFVWVSPSLQLWLALTLCVPLNCGGGMDTEGRRTSDVHWCVAYTRQTQLGHER